MSRGAGRPGSLNKGERDKLEAVKGIIQRAGAETGDVLDGRLVQDVPPELYKAVAIALYEESQTWGQEGLRSRAARRKGAS